MIMTVDELKKHIQTNENDSTLEMKLQALELLIRRYTNNKFQQKNIRFSASAKNGKLKLSTDMLNVGDTIEISQSKYNNGVFVIRSKEGENINLSDILIGEDELLVTKIKYPYDVQMGVVNMMKWELENRDKVGVQSETISRHSVTYFNMDGDNSTMGFPKSLISFLTPYKKARF